MRTCILLMAVVLVAICATGCVTYAGGIAPSNIPLGPSENYEFRGSTSGHSWGINVFGIPFKQANPAAALNKAADGHYAIAEVTISNRDYFLFIMWLQRVRVTGTPVYPKR